MKKKITRKTNRRKKLIKVLKRKWFKPAVYTLVAAFILYTVIGLTVQEKKTVERRAPQFLISRLSDRFDETEFLHLLHTAQELRYVPKAYRQLKGYVNAPNDDNCPKFLKTQLNQMNWDPKAFWIRMHKLFAMYDIYDRLGNIRETVEFLEKEIKDERLPKITEEQVEVLKSEEEKTRALLTDEEYRFISEYYGAVLFLKNEP